MSLESIDIPDGVEFIGDYAFEYCSKLKHMKLPANTKSLSACLLGGCKMLETIELSPYVEDIQNYAFENCLSLRGIRLPLKLKKIGDNILSGVNASCVITYNESQTKIIEKIKNENKKNFIYRLEPYKLSIFNN